MSKDSFGKILIVAVSLCVVCAVVVSSLAVGLRETQEANKVLDQQRNVLVAAGAFDAKDSVPADKIRKLYGELKPQLVELGTGKVVETDPEKVKAFDPLAAAKGPDTSDPIEQGKDIASIKRRAKVARIFYCADGSVVLPFHGMGLWSTMYGYICVKNDDQRTVKGLVYYQHGETAGLGGEVDNPIWRGQFPGKKLFDAQGSYKLQVLKGAGNKLHEHQADGMSGATITTRGVDNMLRYWLGPDGFGPILAKS